MLNRSAKVDFTSAELVQNFTSLQSYLWTSDVGWILESYRQIIDL